MEKKKLETKVARIVANLEAQSKYAFAAAGIAAGDGYCDFFVENGGDGKPFHEKCPEDLIDVEIRNLKYSAARTSRIDSLKLRSSASDSYCDFFVENGGDGKPFHEKCPTKNIKDLLSNPALRAIILSRSQVVKTLQRVLAN